MTYKDDNIKLVFAIYGFVNKMIDKYGEEFTKFTFENHMNEYLRK